MFLKDTNCFLKAIENNSELLSQPGRKLFSIDAKALYPSIKTEFLPVAVRDALDSCTTWGSGRKDVFVKLVEYSVSYAVVHYRDKWYRIILGLPTGGAESVCLANIFVKWVLKNYFSTTDGIKWSTYILVFRRFIDDIFGGWSSSRRQFDLFLNTVNNFGLEYGIFFDDGDIQFGSEVHFLDVTVSVVDGNVHTRLYSKPTDAHRYLHRTSFHPPHTFRSLPFSQMRRAALICSDIQERERTIENMVLYFLECGYDRGKLDLAKDRAMLLSRTELLEYTRPSTTNDTLVFVMCYSVEVAKVKNILNGFKDDIERLTGKKDVIVACKRNANTSAILFNKYGFCQSSPDTNAVDQRCGRARCMTCPILFDGLGDIVLPPDNFTLKLSGRHDCTSEDIIYFAQCITCDDFYFGKSSNKLHIRLNVHRQGFKPGKFGKNALSNHIFNDHNELFGDGMKNFKLGIIDSTVTRNLDRREDYYIWSTDASTKHLNRYHAT